MPCQRRDFVIGKFFFGGGLSGPLGPLIKSAMSSALLRPIYTCASISVSMRWRFFLMRRMLMTSARRDRTDNRCICRETQMVPAYWFYVQYCHAQPQDHEAER
jgi:hypothetical protein